MITSSDTTHCKNPDTSLFGAHSLHPDVADIRLQRLNRPPIDINFLRSLFQRRLKLFLAKGKRAFDLRNPFTGGCRQIAKGALHQLHPAKGFQNEKGKPQFQMERVPNQTGPRRNAHRLKLNT